MIDVFCVKELDKQTEVYGIIAGDTTYTMSPYIHNAAFKAEGINAVFVPFQVTDVEAFMTRMVHPETREVEINLRGFSVTNPHKQTIINYLDHVDEAAAKIGAVNTIKIVDGKLHGFNTDAKGFIHPLKNEYEMKAVHAAVIGAGGAARSCIYALKHAGADVTVFARDAEKAATLSQDFGISVKNLENGNSKPATSFSEFDIVVNSTPVGTRGENINETVATAEQLKGVKIVYDLVYNPSETRLLHEAKSVGAKTIGGFDMLIAQAEEQFRIWTGREAPAAEMAVAAKKRLYDS
jgi:3-dehydroquinate dehydratase/shikimate dehydrogenase